MTNARALRRGVLALSSALVVAALGSAGGGALAVARAGSLPDRAVAHRAGGRAVSSPALPDVDTFYVGHNAAEPTLGVTSEGDVFYAAADPSILVPPVPVDVMRSTDGGRTWEVTSPRLAGANLHASTGDPYVYVDRTEQGSRVFTVDLEGFVCSMLSFSDDGGATWTTNPLGCGRPVNDHQTVFAGPPVESPTVGYPHVVYYCYHDTASSSCSKSLDGGISFVPTGEPTFTNYTSSGEFCLGMHGHGFAGDDGTVYVPKGHCGVPVLAISKDEGATWTRVPVAKLPSAGHEASVAADSKGNVFYAYIGIDMLPYLVISRDGGSTWGRPMMVGRPGVVETSLPSLDVGRSGLVVVGYMGTQDRARSGYEKVEWDGYVTTTRTALTRRPLFYSTSVNEPGDPLVRGECPQTKCGPEYDFIDVVVAPDDMVWAAFVDGCTALCTRAIGANNALAGIASRIRVPR